MVDDCFATDDRVGMRVRVVFRYKRTAAVATRHELVIFRLEGDGIAEIWASDDDLSERNQRAAAMEVPQTNR